MSILLFIAILKAGMFLGLAAPDVRVMTPTTVRAASAAPHWSAAARADLVYPSTGDAHSLVDDESVPVRNWSTAACWDSCDRDFYHS
jgi:hypothetical protein